MRVFEQAQTKEVGVAQENATEANPMMELPRDEIDDIMDEIEKMQSGVASSVTDAEPLVPLSAKKESAPLDVPEPLPSVDVLGDLSGAVEPVLEPEQAPAPEVVFEPVPSVAVLAPPSVPVAQVKPVPIPAPMAAGPASVAYQESSAELAGAGCTLRLTVSGAVSLSLSYEQSDISASVQFRDGYLWVSLADGSEFKVPMGKTQSLRAAA